MMYQRYLLLFVLFYLSACGGSGGGNSNSASPQVEFIQTDVAHMHPSFYEKWDLTPQALRFAASVRVSDPQGIDNLDEIYFYNSALDWYWALLDRNDGFGTDECYFQNYQVYECIFYYEAAPDSLPLADWLVYAVDLDGNETEQPYTFPLPSGAPYDGEGYIYSDGYIGPRFNSVDALEVLEIGYNSLIFESDFGSQSFHIEFTVTDSRVTDYAFVFYDGSTHINYIANANSNSPSIVSTPITIGEITSVDIPWSEINVHSPYSVSDINGLHIKLFDEPEELLSGDGLWFNYLSFSEYLTLND